MASEQPILSLRQDMIHKHALRISGDRRAPLSRFVPHLSLLGPAVLLTTWRLKIHMHTSTVL